MVATIINHTQKGKPMHMPQKNNFINIRCVALAGCVLAAVVCAQTPKAHAQAPLVTGDPVITNAAAIIQGGRNIFRYDTYGDEAFWGDALHLHQAIEGAQFGGVGPGVSPSAALAVGLKVDVDVLPQSLKKKLAAGQVDLNDPANTLALLKLNAVVGVTGFFDRQQRMNSLGIQCALCHSTVDNS